MIRESQADEGLFYGDGTDQSLPGGPRTIHGLLWAKGIPAYKVRAQWRIAKKDLIWLRK